jgi:hypothetical protein
MYQPMQDDFQLRAKRVQGAVRPLSLTMLHGICNPFSL